MSSSSLIERLAALPSLASVPGAQLEWLSKHGEILRFDDGANLNVRLEPLRSLLIVLSGRLSIRVTRGGVGREVREVKAGGISGYLPYSRMTNPAGLVVADGSVEILVIQEGDIIEMTKECYDFTALCVHEMVDRARVFKSYDLHQEKMAALGRLSAGLAHELNNPSSAIGRAADKLNACRLEAIAASRALGAIGLTGAELGVVDSLEAAAETTSAGPDSSLAQVDREDFLGQWLAEHGVDPDLAYPLATTSITAADLDTASSALSAPQLEGALKYVAANVTANRLTAEISSAAARIHSLVTAVKKHTHMDRAPVVESIRIGTHLADTLTLMDAKARAKGVTLDLSVEPDLPPVRGVVGDLNHVWLNLVDNAVDAAPESGRVSVTARREHDLVVVSVIDDGPGISAEDRSRVFEPFFTTKAVGRGAGLGLDVVQAVVQSHRGLVDVGSRPGRTEFRVTLPVAE